MVMKIEYEAGTLHVENALGLRWQLNDVKPEFSFSYDALSVTEQHAVRRLRGSVYPLEEAEGEEVRNFVRALSPPAGITLQRQIMVDLRAFAHGLIHSVITRLEYEGLLDVMITAREGSTDIYAEEARRVLTYVDAVWNAYYGLAAQIRNTPEADLTSAKDYAGTMPFPPAMEHFSNVLPEELFDAAQRNR
jgi:hypothetical protein